MPRMVGEKSSGTPLLIGLVLLALAAAAAYFATRGPETEEAETTPSSLATPMAQPGAGANSASGADAAGSTNTVGADTEGSANATSGSGTGAGNTASTGAGNSAAGNSAGAGTGATAGAGSTVPGGANALSVPPPNTGQ